MNCLVLFFDYFKNRSVRRKKEKARGLKSIDPKLREKRVDLISLEYLRGYYFRFNTEQLPDSRFMVMENREDEECLSLTSVGVEFHSKNDEKKVLNDPSVCLGRTCSRTVYKRSCFVSSFLQ